MMIIDTTRRPHQPPCRGTCPPDPRPRSRRHERITVIRLRRSSAERLLYSYYRPTCLYSGRPLTTNLPTLPSSISRVGTFKNSARGAAPESSARRFAPRGAIAGRLLVVPTRQCGARQPTEPTDRPERRQHRHLRTVRVPIQPQPGLGTSRMVPATLQTSIPTAARTQPGKPSPDEYNRQVGGGHIGGGTSSPRPRTHTSELMARRPYFEKQQDQHCWVHSINMVMGRKHMDVGKIFI